MYNISLSDELVTQARQSFTSDSAMTQWLQQQVEALLVSFNASQQTAKQKARKDNTMEQMLEGYPYKRYSKAELDAMLDEAEANFEAGRGIPDEEAWDDLEEELALQEEEQHEMAEML